MALGVSVHSGNVRSSFFFTCGVGIVGSTANCFPQWRDRDWSNGLWEHMSKGSTGKGSPKEVRWSPKACGD